MEEISISSEKEISKEEREIFDNLVFFRFDEPNEWDISVVEAYNINPLSSEKRIRVYCNQLLYTIIEDITLQNYLNKVFMYYMYGDNLKKKYPCYKKQISNAYLIFWQKTQTKLKKLSKK